MKIDSIQPTISMQGNLTKNIKQKCRMFGLAFSALGYAAKDIFVPRKKVYIEIDGKKIDERDLPNSVSGPSDWAGMKWERPHFSEEDKTKMKSMTPNERQEYRDKLIKEGKYTWGEYEVWE